MYVIFRTYKSENVVTYKSLAMLMLNHLVYVQILDLPKSKCCPAGMGKKEIFLSNIKEE